MEVRLATRQDALKAAKRDMQAQWAGLPFREQIRARMALLDDGQRVVIARMVSTYFNGDLKRHRGAEARLVSLSDFHLAFMDLLYPLRYDQIIAPAQEQLENYYADSNKFAMRQFTADVQGITLPTEETDAWEISFAREFSGAVVVCDMDGWVAKSTILVG